MSTLFQFLIVIACFGSHFAKKIAEYKTYYNMDEAEAIFSDYIVKFDKQYKNRGEYLHRFEIFKEQLRFCNELNAKHPNTTFGINQFTDLTYEEFVGSYTGLQTDDTSPRTAYELVGNAPSSLDYRQQGCVTEIKNQAGCGACYVFSAIGAIEGQHALKHNQLITLSEQQGFDCSEGDCHGGLMSNVMQGLAAQGGSVRASDYTPYTEVKGTCHTDTSKVVVKVRGGEVLTIGDEEALKDALANYGPLSIGLNVCKEFKEYRGDIFTTNCQDPNKRHALLLVGYGNEGVPYWIIKNSWKTEWGEEGYMRLQLGKGLCNIGSYVVRALVD